MYMAIYRYFSGILKCLVSVLFLHCTYIVLTCSVMLCVCFIFQLSFFFRCGFYGGCGKFKVCNNIPVERVYSSFLKSRYQVSRRYCFYVGLPGHFSNSILIYYSPWVLLKIYLALTIVYCIKRSKRQRQYKE